jgi:hypothetical protein
LARMEAPSAGVRGCVATGLFGGGGVGLFEAWMGGWAAPVCWELARSLALSMIASRVGTEAGFGGDGLYAPGLRGGQRLGQPKPGHVVGREEGVRLAGHCGLGEQSVSIIHLHLPFPLLGALLLAGRSVPIGAGVTYIGAAPSFLLAGQSWCVWAGGRGRIWNQACCRADARFEVADRNQAPAGRHLGFSATNGSLGNANAWPGWLGLERAAAPRREDARDRWRCF